MRKSKRQTTQFLNTANYINQRGFNDTGAAIVEEIPVEAIGNSQLERIFNHEQNKPCSGQWMRSASQK